MMPHPGPDPGIKQGREGFDFLSSVTCILYDFDPFLSTITGFNISRFKLYRTNCNPLGFFIIVILSLPVGGKLEVSFGPSYFTTCSTFP